MKSKSRANKVNKGVLEFEYKYTAMGCIKILKTQRILLFFAYCLPTMSFTLNFSYSFMGNKDFIGNFTLELSLKSFIGPGY